MPEGSITLYSLGLQPNFIPQPKEAYGGPLSRIKCLLDLAGVSQQPLSIATESMGLRCLAAAINAQERARALTPLATIPTSIANLVTKVVAMVDAPFPLGIALLGGDSGSLVYISNDSDYHLLPVPIPGRVVDVAAGAEHAVACTSEGDVYVWGFGNAWGQQGDGTVWRDTSECRDSATSSEFASDTSPSLRLSYPKRLPCFGSSIATKVDDFAALAAFKPALIDQVACGRYHTLFVSSSRKAVYSCGWGGCGQLGHGKTWELSPSPRALKKLFGCDVASVHASPDADHSIVVLACGKTMTFGEGSKGALGSGSTKNIWEPTAVVAKDNKHVAEYETGTEGLEEEGETVDNTIARINRENFLFPRRVPRTPNTLEAGDIPAVFVSTSESHTCILAGAASVLTTGLGGPVRLPMKDRTNLRLCPRKGLPPKGGFGVVEPLASPSLRLVDAIGAIGRRADCTHDLLVFDEVEVQTGGEKTAVLRGEDCGPTVLPIAGRGFTLFVDPEGKRRSIRMVGTISDSVGRVVYGSGMKGPTSHNTGSIDIPVGGAVERVFPFNKGAIIAVRE